MKYKVIYRSTTYYEAEIEADSFDGATPKEAKRIIERLMSGEKEKK